MNYCSLEEAFGTDPYESSRIEKTPACKEPENCEYLTQRWNKKKCKCVPLSEEEAKKRLEEKTKADEKRNRSVSSEDSGNSCEVEVKKIKKIGKLQI